jgi:hypothetical protein
MTQEFISAIQYGRKYQLQQLNAWRVLSSAAVDKYDALSDQSISYITSKISSMLQEELEYAKQSMQLFNDLKSGVIAPLKTNKMSDFIIPHCIDFFSAEDGKADRLLTESVDRFCNLEIGTRLPTL